MWLKMNPPNTEIMMIAAEQSERQLFETVQKPPRNRGLFTEQAPVFGYE
jgi:hypothetical protein